MALIKFSTCFMPSKWPSNLSSSSQRPIKLFSDVLNTNKPLSSCQQNKELKNKCHLWKIIIFKTLKESSNTFSTTYFSDCNACGNSDCLVNNTFTKETKFRVFSLFLAKVTTKGWMACSKLCQSPLVEGLRTDTENKPFQNGSSGIIDSSPTNLSKASLSCKSDHLLIVAPIFALQFWSHNLDYSIQKYNIKRVKSAVLCVMKIWQFAVYQKKSVRLKLMAER